MTTSRRDTLKLVGASGLVALPLVRRARAANRLKPVTVLLDWLFQAPNDGFVIAREKGFYEAVGLDAQIQPGKGSGSTAQMIASNVAQFGFADGYVVGNGITKGLDLKMIAAVYRRNPAAVIVLADSSIKSPKDLEHRTIGITTGAAQFQQWPAFAKGCGVDLGKVRVINVDPAGAPAALITGRVDAIGGFAQGYAPGIETRAGKKTRLLWYADCGVNVVSNGIIVRPHLLVDDPQMVRDFVAATLKGFLYGRQHPDEAVAVVKKYAPASDPAIVRREMELSWTTWVTPNTAGKPLGWMSDQDWRETVEVLKAYGGVTVPLDPKSIYTNEFVPTGAEFVPPQA